MSILNEDGTHPLLDSAEVEESYCELVRQIKASVRVPVAIKLSHFFSALANMSKRLALKMGVDVTYRNVPSKIQVPVYTFNAPIIELGKYTIDAKKTDVVYTTGLVLTF